jgi:hypothetical protein
VKRPILFAPLLMTLLMILLLGSIVECSGERVSLYPSVTLVPERSPDIAGDNQLLRVSTLRVPTQKVQSHHEPLLPWFVVLPLSLWSVFCASHCTIPRSYLAFASPRLGGWQESNLQFRFIHSR